MTVLYSIHVIMRSVIKGLHCNLTINSICSVGIVFNKHFLLFSENRMTT